MNRFDRIIQILDTAVGGPDATVGGRHQDFWRQLTRDQFVEYVVIDEYPLLELGSGATSNLVKALRGQDPFDPDGRGQMPLGMDPVPEEQIREIERWIDDRCPVEDAHGEESSTGFTWAPTNAPRDRRSYDDVWFVSPERGWAVCSDGTIIATADGGATWTLQKSVPKNYFRSIAFASPTHGWAGAISGPVRLLATTDGAEWTEVTLPEGAPKGICGLWPANESVVVAAGTNLPFGFGKNPPPAVMRTTDGGATWTATDMRRYASCLIDVYFPTPERGWVVGAMTDRDPGVAGGERDDLKPVVLYTADGGRTWTDQVAAIRGTLPRGEWGWKIQFLNDSVGYVSLMSFKTSAVLKTTDGGASWRRLPLPDDKSIGKIKGIGFVDTDHGWAGDTLSTNQCNWTADGGAHWTSVHNVGSQINRFRLLGNPVSAGYAAGGGIFRYADRPLPAPSSDAPALGATLIPDRITEADDGRRVVIPVSVPEGARTLVVAAWDEFGSPAGTIREETAPEPGSRTVTWDTSGLSDDHIVRVTVDGDSQSQRISISRS